MTKKDFYRIIIKLFGLYTAIGLLVYMLPQNLITLYYSEFNSYTFLSFSVLAIVAALLYVLIFKTDVVVNLFRLDKGYDDDKVDLAQFNAEGVLKLGMIIISGFLIIDNIPDFLVNVFYAFKSNVNSGNALTSLLDLNPSGVSYFMLAKSAINLVLGFLMLTNLNFLAGKLNKVNNKHTH